MKTRTMTLAALLLSVASCMAQKAGTLVFEKVSYADTLTLDAKFMDYSSDEEPTPYEIGEIENRYVVNTLRATSGPAAAMTFINQWLMLNAAGSEPDKPVNAQSVAAMFAEMQASPDFAGKTVDINTAMQVSAHKFITPEAPDELPELFMACLCTGDFYTNTVSVKSLTANYITFVEEGYVCNIGAVHGIPWMVYSTFDLQKLRLLTLDDMITEAGKRKVLQMITKELRALYGNETLISEIDFPANDPAFTADGVIFAYGPYEIGPYAIGMPSVTLPYKKIQQYLTPQAKALLK